MKRVFICLMLFFVSCKGLLSFSFWANYKKSEQAHSMINQGPFGGKVALHWIMKEQAKINRAQIIAFAEQHGWQLQDSAAIDTATLNTWPRKDGHLTFPLSYEGFELRPALHHKEWDAFPLWIEQECTVYMFKTGLILIQPGTDESTVLNGFLLLSKDKKEFCVYQLWGE